MTRGGRAGTAARSVAARAGSGSDGAARGEAVGGRAAEGPHGADPVVVDLGPPGERYFRHPVTSCGWCCSAPSSWCSP